MEFNGPALHINSTEKTTSVPPKSMKQSCTNEHTKLMDHGFDRTIWFFQKYFFVKDSNESLKKILKNIVAECPRMKARPSTSTDRGEVRSLPIPNQVISILYIM